MVYCDMLRLKYMLKSHFLMALKIDMYDYKWYMLDIECYIHVNKDGSVYLELNI